MHYSVYAGLLFAALFGVVGPAVARRIRPAAATWMVTIGGLASGLSAFAAMTLLSLTLVAQNDLMADHGHWSIAALREANPVRWPVAAVALTAVAFDLFRLGRLVLQHARVRRARRRAVGLAVSADSDLIVLPDAGVEAYAMPGRPGRIFLTKGILRLLDDDERHVVIAHERSHLRHRHHLHRLAASLSSALNPLLYALPRTQEWATERWADEDAATVAERAVVASALRKASSRVRSVPPEPGIAESALAVASAAVDRRVAALYREPPRLRPLFLALASAVVALSVLGTSDAVVDTAALLHAAITAQQGRSSDRPAILSQH